MQNAFEVMKTENRVKFFIQCDTWNYNDTAAVVILPIETMKDTPNFDIAMYKSEIV